MIQAHRDGTDVMARDAAPVVLVVDDDAEVRELLSQVLQNAGFRPVTASRPSSYWT
jgi:PleD family two-component response regulator